MEGLIVIPLTKRHNPVVYRYAWQTAKLVLPAAFVSTIIVELLFLKPESCDQPVTLQVDHQIDLKCYQVFLNFLLVH